MILKDLPDNAERKRFTTEVQRNFSVLAPAGVGKTMAIVDRIAEIALADAGRSEPILPRMVVVTYTRKAAAEMQMRAYNRLVGHSVPAELLSRLNQAFFGTIHSFCLNLLKTYGHLLGLPGALEVVEDDEALWVQFCREADRLAGGLPESARARFLRHMPLGQILNKPPGSRHGSDDGRDFEVSQCPRLNTAKLLEFEPSKRNVDNVAEGRNQLRKWIDQLEQEGEYLPIPVYDLGGNEFRKLWLDTFQPLRDWLGDSILGLSAQLNRQYLDFRISRGILTHDDLIYLAVALLRNTQAAERIRERGFRVVLDEAQDTDPRQFQILTEIARPLAANGVWMSEGGEPPAPGHFCMVGDPQQSIYSSRVSLPAYQKLHDDLVGAGAAEELEFKVTMRCDRAIVSTVNKCFPGLSGSGKPGEQVRFAKLVARPGAGKGQAVRLVLESPEDSKRSHRFPAQASAEALATWLKKTGLDALGARRWSEVAILCPRRGWLQTLDNALQLAGFKTQNHSREEIRGDNPAHAWLAALMRVACEPENAFEISGVLREIFGLSDHDIAVYCHTRKKQSGTAHALQILENVNGTGPVPETLKKLAQIRRETKDMALRDAVCHWVTATDLRKRLAALPDYRKEDMLDQLDELLVQAAVAEAEQLSLVDWANRLEDDFGKKGSEGASAPDFIQLLTCHKAKGLEWDAVLLPFFFRKISFPNISYPYIFQHHGATAPAIAIDKFHEREDLKYQLEQERLREVDRLLYVSMTRARRTLVLVDDTAILNANNHSFAGRLQVKPAGKSRETWEALPETLIAEEPEASGLRQDERPTFQEETYDPHCAARAIERALSAIKRVLPSSLAIHRTTRPGRDEPEPRLGSEFPDEVPVIDGAAYGNWWHDMMESTPWVDGEKAWLAHFNKHKSLPYCPDPERAEKEIKNFLDSELALLLGRPGMVVRTEVPFLWKDDAQTAFEGYIDLVACDDEKEDWILVDWKTDRPSGKNQEATLRKQYSPQLEAYTKVLRGIFKKPVHTILYSTNLGRALSVKSTAS